MVTRTFHSEVVKVIVQRGDPSEVFFLPWQNGPTRARPLNPPETAQTRACVIATTLQVLRLLFRCRP
jgi:hypothetical protein